MRKTALLTFVFSGTLMAASMAHANASSNACTASPATAGPVISGELSGIAKLNGTARTAALDAFVLDLANTKYSTPTGTACAAAAISQAAQLYALAEDRQRVTQIASSLSNPDIETAAIDNPNNTGGFDGPRGSNN